MMKLKRLFPYVVLIFLVGILSFAQESKVDRTTVPFSDPSRPGLVKVDVYKGAVTVKGYNGKEVVVEARVRGKMISEKKEVTRKAKGMKLIQVATTGLEIEEENNVIEIDVESQRHAVDLTIQVPYATSLEIDSYTNGDIIVENIKGDIEVEKYKGELKLSSISGSAVAQTYSGSIVVTFTKVEPGKPMSFSNYSGDIDVTFPADIKATVKMKSNQGDIYSDFDISIKPSPQKVEKPKEKGGRYRVSFDYFYGTINGGGAEYHFKTYNGDIFIRKAK
jgi:DUF4097 and DUF4098 domain-containing protein YvlB